MAGILPGNPLPEQRTILQSGAGRSIIFRWSILRRFSLQIMVVRRMDRSSSRRQITNCPREISFPSITDIGKFLAWFARKGLCKVSVKYSSTPLAELVGSKDIIRRVDMCRQFWDHARWRNEMASLCLYFTFVVLSSFCK